MIFLKYVGKNIFSTSDSKFRIVWCIWLHDSYWICQYSLYFVHIHAYANMNSRENVGKFDVNHIVLYINRREISRWFRIWSQKNIFAYAFSRKSRFKNLRRRIQKFWFFFWIRRKILIRNIPIYLVTVYHKLWNR